MQLNAGGTPRWQRKIRKNSVSLFQNISLDEKTGCWNWTGCKNNKGYGKMYFRGRLTTVNRVVGSLYLRLDENPKLHVLHNCDNPACFNPKHLHLGTHADNIREAKERFRFPRQRQTHCKYGHLLPEPNHTDKKGRLSRVCIKCHSIFSLAKWRLKKWGHTGGLPLPTKKKGKIHISEVGTWPEGQEFPRCKEGTFEMIHCSFPKGSPEYAEIRRLLELPDNENKS